MDELEVLVAVTLRVLSPPGPFGWPALPSDPTPIPGRRYLRDDRMPGMSEERFAMADAPAGIRPCSFELQSRPDLRVSGIKLRVCAPAHGRKSTSFRRRSYLVRVTDKRVVEPHPFSKRTWRKASEGELSEWFKSPPATARASEKVSACQQSGNRGPRFGDARSPSDRLQWSTPSRGELGWVDLSPSPLRSGQGTSRPRPFALRNPRTVRAFVRFRPNRLLRRPARSALPTPVT